MYPRSFLCEKAKIKQRTPLKRELCEIGEEAIWEFRFTSFFWLYYYYHKVVKFLHLVDVFESLKDIVKVSLKAISKSCSFDIY